MKMISLLITLGIIGYVVWQQLGGSSGALPQARDPAEVRSAPPRVPTQPGGVGQFDADMDAFMDAQADHRRDEIEEQTE